MRSDPPYLRTSDSAHLWARTVSVGPALVTPWPLRRSSATQNARLRLTGCLMTEATRKLSAWMTWERPWTSVGNCWPPDGFRHLWRNKKWQTGFHLLSWSDLDTVHTFTFYLWQAETVHFQAAVLIAKALSHFYPVHSYITHFHQDPHKYYPSFYAYVFQVICRRRHT